MSVTINTTLLQGFRNLVLSLIFIGFFYILTIIITVVPEVSTLSMNLSSFNDLVGMKILVNVGKINFASLHSLIHVISSIGL